MRERVTAIVNVRAAEVLSSFVYSYDATGRRALAMESGGRNDTYKYDNLDRLVSETITDPIHGNEQIDYTYDAVGNRLTRTDSNGTLTYTYDANDRLIAAGGTTFQYDANGNMIARQDGSTLTTYTYDDSNRLIAVHTGSRDDKLSIRCRRQSRDGESEGHVTHFLVDTAGRLPQVVEERDAQGNLIARYHYGSSLVSQYRGGQTLILVTDAQLSTRQLVNDAGQVTDSYGFDAFGGMLFHDGTSDNHYLYTGEQADGTGLYYLRARYYDASLGQFTSMDRYQGMEKNTVFANTYSYASGSPVEHGDPSGHFVQFLALGLVVGFLLFERWWSASMAAVMAGTLATGAALLTPPGLAGLNAYQVVSLYNNRGDAAASSVFTDDLSISAGWSLITFSANFEGGPSYPGAQRNASAMGGILLRGSGI